MIFSLLSNSSQPPFCTFMELNFFPGIFFFRHPSKSCSVFYTLHWKQKQIRRYQKNQVHEDSKKKLNFFFDLSEFFFCFQYVKNCTTFALMTEKKIFLEKKNTSIKCTFKRRGFFRPKRGTMEELWNLL